MTRDEAISYLLNMASACKYVDTAIDALQAEQVKHGEWINKRLTKDSIKDIKDGTYGELIGYHDVCSICGFDIDKYWHGYKPPYCPNCGAKMGKGKEE